MVTFFGNFQASSHSPSFLNPNTSFLQIPNTNTNNHGVSFTLVPFSPLMIEVTYKTTFNNSFAVQQMSHMDTLQGT